MSERKLDRQESAVTGEGALVSTALSFLPQVRELRQTIQNIIASESLAAPTLPEQKIRPYRRRNEKAVWPLRDAR